MKVVVFFINNAIAENCVTQGANLLYRCNGENLFFIENRELFRPEAIQKYHISICQTVRGDLLMEIFPLSYFIDFPSPSDAVRTTVRHAVVYESGFAAKRIYQPNCSEALNYQTTFTLIFRPGQDYTKTFRAVFFNGRPNNAELAGRVYCRKYGAPQLEFMTEH